MGNLVGFKLNLIIEIDKKKNFFNDMKNLYNKLCVILSNSGQFQPGSEYFGQ